MKIDTNVQRLVCASDYWTKSTGLWRLQVLAQTMDACVTRVKMHVGTVAENSPRSNQRTLSCRRWAAVNERAPVQLRASQGCLLPLCAAASPLREGVMCALSISRLASAHDRFMCAVTSTFLPPTYGHAKGRFRPRLSRRQRKKAFVSQTNGLQ